MQNAKKIIVVDDETDICSCIKRILTQKGYDVSAFTDGREALESLKAMRWADMIILDIMMPNMNGFQALQELKDLGFAEIPIIFVTAKSESGDVARGHDMGASIYLTKPFEPEALLNAVSYLIGEPANTG